MIKNSETHLIIIWERGRSHQGEILDDIRSLFCVKKVFEIEWSKKKVSENFTRFYGTKLPPGSFKEKECGTGPFLLVVFEDKNPVYETRETTAGLAEVNKNIFDRKKLYREKNKGGFRIHSTNDPKETNHDLMLLLGISVNDFNKKYPNDWNDSIEHIKQDIVASDGWENISQFFTVLNETINYLVLRNYECLPDEFTMDEHGDIDLLVENVDEIVHLTQAKKVVNKNYRVHYSININGDEVLFDFRHVGDNYYDLPFEETLLKQRTKNSKNIYVPADEDYFYSLLYHALIQKPKIGADYVERLKNQSQKIGVIDFEKNYNRGWKKYLSDLLGEYLKAKGYRYTVPIDKSVYFNYDNIISDIELIGRPKWIETLKRRDFIKIRLRANQIVLHLFCGVIPKNVFRLKLRIGGIFRIDICLGQLKDL